MVESCPLSCGGTYVLHGILIVMLFKQGLFIYTFQSCSLAPNTLNLPNTSGTMVQKLMLQNFVSWFFKTFGIT
jgi:hypothetical protein